MHRKPHTINFVIRIKMLAKKYFSCHRIPSLPRLIKLLNTRTVRANPRGAVGLWGFISVTSNDILFPNHLTYDFAWLRIAWTEFWWGSRNDTNPSTGNSIKAWPSRAPLIPTTEKNIARQIVFKMFRSIWICKCCMDWCFMCPVRLHKISC